MEFSRVESSIHQKKDEIKSIKELTENSSTQQQPSATMETVLKENLGTICEKNDLLKPVENSTPPPNIQPVNGNNDVQLPKQLRIDKSKEAGSGIETTEYENDKVTSVLSHVGVNATISNITRLGKFNKAEIDLDFAGHIIKCLGCTISYVTSA